MSWGRVAFGLLAPALLGISLASCDTTGQSIAPFAGAPAGTVQVPSCSQPESAVSVTSM